MALPTTHRRMTASEYFENAGGATVLPTRSRRAFHVALTRLSAPEVLLELARLIANFLKCNPLGVAAIAPSDVELGNGDVYQPDLYYVSRERLGILDQQGAKGAPDLVVEILSPSTARLDRDMKRTVYESAGVREIWFVDLWNDRVEVHRFSEVAGAATVLTLERKDRLTTPLLPVWRFW